jgi:NADH:ubiquinone oxidoreductase subunit F (NADH-binding)
LLHLQDSEFIAAEPCDGILWLRAGTKALRDRSKQLVSGTMTKRIVDRLEPIQIEHENCKLICGTTPSRNSMLESLKEQQPVRESG